MLQAWKVRLDVLFRQANLSPSTILAGVDASLPKDNRTVAVSAAVLTRRGEDIISIRHPAGLGTAPDAELFAIRSAIVRATQEEWVSRIIIFTDSPASARRALDPSVHSGQGHSLAVCRALSTWFTGHPD